jgi:hypothetical protein
MNDKNRLKELQEICAAMQEQFNRQAVTFKRVATTLKKAQEEKNMVASRLGDLLHDIGICTRELQAAGAGVPVLITDQEFFRQFGRDYQVGELHAELDAIAAAQGFGPKAGATK